MKAEIFLQWFDEHKRDLPWRGVNNPYFTWLSEVMLQQTGVKTVIPYFEKFIAKWPTVAALANASQQEVLSEWAGLGYYSRARNLHACASQLAAHFPNTAKELAQLKGLGPYASAAIAAICFNERIAVVDGNVERVITRLYALENSKDVRDIVQSLVPIQRAGDFAESLMEFGATLCTPKNPRCQSCPFATQCKAYLAGEPLKYPIKKQKPKIPHREEKTYVVRREDGAVLLFSRPQKGLFAGMAELPNAPPLKGDYVTLNTRVKHIFTHFSLEVTILTLTVPNTTPPPEGGRFVQDLTQEALPTLYKKVLAIAL